MRMHACVYICVHVLPYSLSDQLVLYFQVLPDAWVSKLNPTYMFLNTTYNIYTFISALNATLFAIKN
jgi:hypothetical protein